MDQKDQVTRTRENNDPASFSSKPALDENKGAGLRGSDKGHGALQDTRGGTQASVPGAVPTKQSTQQTAHQRGQHGADVREPDAPPDVVKTEGFELPEGLQRQRQGPYDKNSGRLGNGDAIERKQDGSK